MNVESSSIPLYDLSQKAWVDAEFFCEILPEHIADTKTKWLEFWNAHMQSSLMVEQSRHWDWGKKVEEMQGLLECQTFAIICEGDVQGLMIANNTSKYSRIESHKGQSIVYIEYLEVAPWNRLGDGRLKRYKYVGSVMVAVAIKLSIETGFHGRIGLHSLPQSEGFYLNNCKMIDLGIDERYQNLKYFEMTQEMAQEYIK